MMRSSVALANSAPSRSPRSSAGTMSAGAICTADMPSVVNMSTASPEVRNFMPFRSSGPFISFLNQPMGSHGTGPPRKLTMFSCAACWISAKSSLPPPYSTQPISWLASMPKSGPGAVEAERDVLAEPERGDAVAAVEHALAHRLDHLQPGHDGAGGQHLDLELARR